MIERFTRWLGLRPGRDRRDAETGRPEAEDDHIVPDMFSGPFTRHRVAGQAEMAAGEPSETEKALAEAAGNERRRAAGKDRGTESKRTAGGRR